MTKHLPHYVSLIGILVATIVGFVAFSYDKNFQRALIASASVGYFTWGVVHHILHRDLSLEIVIEYAVIACLGFVVGVSVV